MDLKRLLNALEEKKTALFQARFPSPGVQVHIDNFYEQINRIRAVERRVRRHKNWKRAAQRDTMRQISLSQELDLVRLALSEGKTLLAFDLEWHRQHQTTQEIGLTTYRSGSIVSENIQLKPLGRRFNYGISVMTSKEKAVEMLVARCEAADYYVGQSISNDFRNLRQNGIVIPERPHFDTERLARAFTRPEDGRSLTALCKAFGIDCSNMHCAGNDARYTLEVLLAMVNFGQEPTPVSMTVAEAAFAREMMTS